MITSRLRYMVLRFSTALYILLIFQSCSHGPGIDRPITGYERFMDLNEYELTFRDEFDGETLNEDIWFTDPYWRPNHPQQHIINDERQAYIRDAIELQDGVLRIKIQKQHAPYAGQVMDYTSGLISTWNGGFGQKYGYFEIRCRLPATKGLWPAFWLFPRKDNKFGSPGSEIDVFEYWPHENRDEFAVNIHWDGYEEYHRSDLHRVKSRNLTNEFNVYGVEITPNEVVFFFNGKEIAHHSGPGVSHDHMHLIANCAVVSRGAKDSLLPDYFEIDYIRVYQRKKPFVDLHY